MKAKLCLLLCGALCVAQLATADAMDLSRIFKGNNTSINTTINKSAEKAVQKMDSRNITFTKLPMTAAEVAPGQDAQMVAAYTVAALARYETDPAEAIAMLDALRGPRPLNGMDKQFLQDRFRGKTYLMRSYFKGATPENNYTPVQPYRVTVSENTYSRTQFVDGYLTLYVACSGADSPRPLKLRNKPSTGQWFLWEQQLLTGIRIPQVADPWA